MVPCRKSVTAQRVRGFPLFEVHRAQLEAFSFLFHYLRNLRLTPRGNAQLNQGQAGVKGGYQANPFIGFKDEAKQVDVGGSDDEVPFRTSSWLPLQGFPLLFHQSLWYQRSWHEGKRGSLKKVSRS